MALPKPTATLLSQLPPLFLLPRFAHHCRPAQIQRRCIQTIQDRPGPTIRWNKGHGLPMLQGGLEASLERKKESTPLRTGALATKRGMSAVYDPATGVRTPVTIVQMDRVQVVAHLRKEKAGYWGVQVGTGHKQARNVSRPMLGHFASHGVSPKRRLTEFRVRDGEGLLHSPVGTMLEPHWFQVGQFVDARANCKGKGFAGGMKRHGFRGQDRSHGVSLTHRSMGSAGQSQGGGSRVYPGKRMPGKMGGQQVTVQNVRVIAVDNETGIITLHGCIPGPNGCTVKLSDAIKKPWPAIELPAAAATAPQEPTEPAAAAAVAA